MSTTAITATALIVASLGLIGYALAGRAHDPRHLLRGGLTTLFVGAALLMGAVIPSGIVGTLTQFIFLAAAAVFLVQEVMASIGKRQDAST